MQYLHFKDKQINRAWSFQQQDPQEPEGINNQSPLTDETDKQNVVDTYNESIIQLKRKKFWHVVNVYIMGSEIRHKGKCCIIHLYKVPRKLSSNRK